MRGRSYTAKVVDLGDVGRPSNRRRDSTVDPLAASASARCYCFWAPSTFACPLALPPRLIYSSLCRCLPFFFDFFFISVLLPVFCFRKRQPLIYTPSLHRAGASEGAFAFTRYCRSLPLLCSVPADTLCSRRPSRSHPRVRLARSRGRALAKHQRRGTLLTNTVRCARCERQFRDCITCQRGIAFQQVYITCGMRLVGTPGNRYQTRNHC